MSKHRASGANYSDKHPSLLIISRQLEACSLNSNVLHGSMRETIWAKRKAVESLQNIDLVEYVRGWL
jgi:hypothetical protein